MEIEKDWKELDELCPVRQFMKVIQV